MSLKSLSWEIFLLQTYFYLIYINFPIRETNLLFYASSNFWLFQQRNRVLKLSPGAPDEHFQPKESELTIVSSTAKKGAKIQDITRHWPILQHSDLPWICGNLFHAHHMAQGCALLQFGAKEHHLQVDHRVSNSISQGEVDKCKNTGLPQVQKSLLSWIPMLVMTGL